ncbi:lateral root primordium 1-like protein, partial [Tanacetum coccineum]
LDGSRFTMQRSTRLPSDSGAFADWVAHPSSSSALIRSSAHHHHDLSLGFNGGSAATAQGGGPTGVWSSAANRHQMNYGEMGMFGVNVGVGVIPLLATTPSWQTEVNYLKKPSFSEHVFGGCSGGGGGGGGVLVAAPSGSSLTCQDCGNQAKKDCSHRRCRTCCKSRGFECATHVKSTWVPAARRRERQLVTATGMTAAGSSVSTSVTKKPRLSSRTTTASHTSTSNNTTPRSFDTSSSHQRDASFTQQMPGQVRAPAVFKCVKVTAVDDGNDEYAYQACVTIGGHIFRGFLYDQGVHESRDQTSIPKFSELHLGGGSAGVGARNVGGSFTSPPLDPPVVYSTPGGGLLG